MPICHTWVEYVIEGDAFVRNDEDISALDFGDILPNSSSEKYIGLRYLGNSSEEIKIWMDGAYADVYNYDVSTPVLYEQEITENYDIRIYGQLVSTPAELVGDPDPIPNSLNPLSLTSVTANYKDAGYTDQILAIKIEVPSDALTGYYYRGLRLLLSYETV
jgi:hypothetical protein